MAIPILKNWKEYYKTYDEGLGSSYERVVLNKKLLSLCRKYQVSKLLEAPSFGFTGISGINSVHLAKQGIEVTLIDNSKERLDLIKSTWESLDLRANLTYSADFMVLKFPENHFDLSWNFSALWFVEELESFIQELTRVTKKIIVICVPNRAGIGYISQKYLGRNDLKELLKEDFILPKNFIREMRNNRWELIETDFIDSPPWPDIGMHKEKFLKTIGLAFLVKEESREPLCIMDYYKGKNIEFQNEMLKHFWFEKTAPWLIKRFWAHHRYYIFVPSNER